MGDREVTEIFDADEWFGEPGGLRRVQESGPRASSIDIVAEAHPGVDDRSCRLPERNQPPHQPEVWQPRYIPGFGLNQGVENAHFCHTSDVVLDADVVAGSHTAA